MSMLGDVAREVADKPLVVVAKTERARLFQMLHDKELIHVFADTCTRHLDHGLLGRRRSDDDSDRKIKREHRQRLAETAPRQIHDRR